MRIGNFPWANSTVETKLIALAKGFCRTRSAGKFARPRPNNITSPAGANKIFGSEDAFLPENLWRLLPPPPLEPKIFVPKEGREEITGHIFDLPWAEITFVQHIRPKGTKSEGFPLPWCIIMATLPEKNKQKRWWTSMKHTMTLLVSKEIPEMLAFVQTFLQKKTIKAHLPALPVRPGELGWGPVPRKIMHGKVGHRWTQCFTNNVWHAPYALKFSAQAPYFGTNVCTWFPISLRVLVCIFLPSFFLRLSFICLQFASYSGCAWVPWGIFCSWVL